MRLSLSVNERLVARASLEAKGWLSAHVNLREGIDSDSNRVWLNAIDVSGEPNTTHSTWDSVALTIGDKVEIEVLSDGDADPPTSISRTSESPNNLFANVEHARLLFAAIRVCDAELWSVLAQVHDGEPSEEFKKIQNAIASVLVELDRQLISPTLRRHPELLAEAQEMKLR